MSRKITVALYDMATPLSEAWLEFAAIEHKTALSECGRFGDAFTNSAQSVSDHENRGMALLDCFNAGAMAEQHRNSLVSEMRERLLDILFNSELIALGVRQRPSKSHYPVKIDAEFFDYVDADWGTSTLEQYGKLYSNVRIYNPNSIEKAPARQRRGSAEIIDQAIAELKLEISNFCNLPRKSACQMVREKLGHGEISGNGLSDKNLAKRIVAQCGTRRISN